MGLFDKVSGGIIKGVQNINDEIKRRQEIKEAKYCLLERMTIYDIKKLNRVYGVGQPSGYEEDFNGNRTRITLNRDDYVDHAAENLTLDQIKDFSEKNKKRTPASINEPKEKIVVNPLKYELPVKEETSAQSAFKPKPATQPSFSDYDDILKYITEFKPEDISSEKDFQKQLTIHLRTKYKEKVEREFATPRGKIDIVIDKRFAFELKIADNKGVLRNLKGQVHDYKKEFKSTTVILLDVSKLSDAIINEFVVDCQNMGVKTLKIKGVLKKAKPKSK
jgi:hypothetical protein